MLLLWPLLALLLLQSFLNLHLPTAPTASSGQQHTTIHWLLQIRPPLAAVSANAISAVPPLLQSRPGSTSNIHNQPVIPYTNDPSLGALQALPFCLGLANEFFCSCLTGGGNENNTNQPTNNQQPKTSIYKPKMSRFHSMLFFRGTDATCCIIIAIAQSNTQL